MSTVNALLARTRAAGFRVTLLPYRRINVRPTPPPDLLAELRQAREAISDLLAAEPRPTRRIAVARDFLRRHALVPPRFAPIVATCTATLSSPTMRGMSAGNSTQTALRVVGRPFRPGESGNVNGRPKRDAEFAAACREQVPRIVAMLEKSLRSPSWREAHSAAVILLSYGYGKPTQPIGQDPEAPLQILHLHAAQDASRRLQAELGARPTPEPTEAQPNIIDLAALPAPTE